MDPALDRSRCFVLREDDWRQLEFVSADQLDTVAEQCAAIRRIHSEHSHPVGDLTAFDTIQVRSAPANPITTRIPLAQLASLLPAVARQYSGVSFRGGTGAVPNSFAMGFSDCVLYGLSTSEDVLVLAVHGNRPVAVEPLRSLGLSMVDWIGATIL